MWGRAWGADGEVCSWHHAQVACAAASIADASAVRVGMEGTPAMPTPLDGTGGNTRKKREETTARKRIGRPCRPRRGAAQRVADIYCIADECTWDVNVKALALQLQALYCAS